MVQFFESDNAEDLAAKIFDLMQNPDRRIVLCDCSSEFIAHNNWDVKKHAYLDLVDRLVA
jgi:acetone carboxylase gamma subunit